MKGELYRVVYWDISYKTILNRAITMYTTLGSGLTRELKHLGVNRLLPPGVDVAPYQTTDG